ncbi:MAG TPA: hypothetical protein DG577_09805 [Firmicutes bacterium]|nr:hypothetical protein [Bacillota bacterium]
MLIAKTDPIQSLQEHSFAALEALAELAENLLPVWQRRQQDIGYSPPNLQDILTYLVACHDLGKAMEPWQRYIRGQGPHQNHSLFSMMLAKEVWPGRLDANITAALLAILSHHGQLHNESSQGSKTAAMGKIDFDQDKVTAALKQLGDYKPLAFSSLTGADCAKCVASLIHAVRSMEPDDKLKFKALYCFYHALLRLADNEASARHKGKGGMIYSCYPAVDGFSHSPPATAPNEIQRLVTGKDKWLILRAGCGVGKTGAALKFAMEHIKAGRADRVIFTLPTQFTTNSMYWDLEPKYSIPKELAGIYHSEIEGVLKLEADDDNFIKSEKYQNTFYNKPVTVSTVDHLLYSLLHCYKYADRAFGNIFTSVVVFDEVHYYDHFTLNKIGQCLELMRDLQIPHMIMTATMPQAVLDRLQKQAKGGYAVITQEETVPAKPYTVIRAQNPMADEKGKVSKDLLALIRNHQGYKQMVVVNRVELAKDLARTIKKKFRNANVICYHSQFCRQDRTEKERLIKILFSPKDDRTEEQRELLCSWDLADTEEVILVSTQVCELSLDISADIMYSQIAPVDSIIQRGGRLHRKGITPHRTNCGCPGCRGRQYLKEKHQYILYLFPLVWDDEKSFFPYGLPEQRQWTLDSWDVIQGDYSFAKAMKWVDSVFTEAPLLYDLEMKSMMLEDVVFGRTPAERYGDEDAESSSGSFKVRDIQQATVTVMPACFENEAKQDEKDAYSNLGVKVPPWLFCKYGRKDDKLWFLELPYTREFGFQFERRK